MKSAGFSNLQSTMAAGGALRSTLLLAIGQAFSLFGIFLSGVLIARAFGPRTFGTYSAAFALGSLIVGGSAAGMPILILRRTSEGDIDRRTLGKALRLLLGYLVLTLAITGSLGIVLFGGGEGAIIATSAGLFFAFNNIASLGQYVHVGCRRYPRAACVGVVSGTLFPVFTFLSIRLHAGIAWCLISISIASGVSCLVAWTKLPKLEFGKIPSALRARDSLALNGYALLNGGYGRIDTVILLAVAGSGAAGNYSAAYRLLGPFSLISAAFAPVYFSRLSEYNHDPEAWSRVRRHGSFLFGTVSIIGMVTLFIFLPFTIHFLYGPHYGLSVGPAKILMLSLVPWALYYLKPAALASVHLETRATIALGLGLIVDFLLVIVFGRRFGATGAAWAWVASESVMYLVLRIMSRNIVNKVVGREHVV